VQSQGRARGLQSFTLHPQFHVSADTLPNGGQDAIRRVLFVTGPGATPRPALEITQEKNRTQGKTVVPRADLLFDVTAAPHLRTEQSRWDDSRHGAIGHVSPWPFTKQAVI